MINHSSPMMRTYLTIIILLLLTGSSTALASLEDRILVLAPWVEGEGARDRARLWDILELAYSEGMEGVEIVPRNEVFRASEGDTLCFDLFSLGEAEQWGQALEVDAVVMAEDIGGTVRVQRFDPWSLELFGPVEAGSALVAVRELESDRWIYGNGLIPPPPGIAPPNLSDASKTLSTWLHENNEFPQEAIIQLIAASVHAEVAVTAEGIPLTVKLTLVDPPGFEFETAAARAFWAARFEPATLNGRPVNGMWKGAVDLSPTR